MKISVGLLIKRALPFALALGIWFAPVPAGLTAPAWHLFAVFVSAIVAVLVGAFPLLTSTMLAVAAVVMTGTITPAQAFGGFANTSVLLVVIAFLVAQAVVKSGLGRRISLFMVSRFGRSSMGLAYSIVLTDAVIAPAFPSNTARGGVLFPIVLSVAEGSGSQPHDPEGRRLGGYLMFCAMASLAVSSALWMTATSANPIGIQLVREYGIQIGFGKWLIASSVPALTAILALPWIIARLFPPGVGETPEAPVAARKALAALGPFSRDERITAVAFALMVSGWIFADTLHMNVTSIAFAGLGLLLMAGVLTLEDICHPGRYADHVSLACRAIRLERATQRTRLHGLRRPDPGEAHGGPLLASDICRVDRNLRRDPLHVRESVVPGPCPLGRLSRRRHPRRRSRTADGIRAALREQLLLRDHPAGRKPERNFRGQRLSHATRTLQARAVDDPVLHGRVPGDRNGVDPHGDQVNRLKLERSLTAKGLNRRHESLRRSLLCELRAICIIH